MRQSYFNTVVKRLLKFKGKVIQTDKLKSILQNILDLDYSDKKVYKLIYYLKNRGYIVSIKKDIFFIKNPEDNFNLEDVIEKNYRNILKNHCKNPLNNDRYIGGLKALELNFNNFDIPDEIDIINPHKQSRESVLTEKFIKFKKYSCKNIDIYKKFKKHTNKIKIGKNSLLIADIELAILESLYNPDIITEKYTKELIKKILRKYKKSFDFSKLTSIIKFGKHISSINRLYNIARIIDPKFGMGIYEIIKKYSFVLKLD